jgi:hypothetical protein
MRKIISLLIIITSFLGCKKDNTVTKGNPVNLIADDNSSIFNKTVILFDDNKYLIKTPLDTFILGYPFNILDGYYNYLKPKAINDGTQKNVLIVSDYMDIKGDTIYAIAYHLERGSCYVFDKIAKQSIKTVYVEQWAEGGPMSSMGGRRFYINNKLFFETVDMISK